MDAIDKAVQKTKQHLKQIESNPLTTQDHLDNLKNIIEWLSEKNKNQQS
jgi:hypothetical protein